MKRKLLAVSMATLLAGGTLVGCGGGMVQFEEKEADKTKSYLYISTPTGGFGTRYLKAVANKFMEANAEAHYAEGKTGVIVEVKADSGNTSNNFLVSPQSAPSEINIVEGLYYTDLLGTNSIIDLTDIVRAPLADGKTIEQKLNTEQKEVLLNNGKYYTLPTFAGYTGITYNADMFAENNFYFSNSTVSPVGVKSSYTDQAYTGRRFVNDMDEEKSPGPDGILGNDDDGLPSSYEEFFYLCDAMLAATITPLIYYNGHYTNYLFQELLCAASTADGLKSTFSFDSNGKEVEVVTGWKNDGSPNVENVVITEENGYYATKQLAKYKAVKFIEHLSTGKEGDYIYGGSRGTMLTSHVHSAFLEGILTNNPDIQDVGMLLEGVYWYNEASGTIGELEGIYGDAVKNINLKYMPLPAKETGTVVEEKGSTQLVVDSLQYYLVVNAKVKNSKEKLDLATDFLKFMYTDAMLQEMTITSGIPLALNYELKESQYNSMSSLSKSCWDVYKKAKDNDAYITGMSLSPIFANNVSKFSFKSTNDAFRSKASGEDIDFVLQYFYNKWTNNKTYSVNGVFDGMTISQKDWLDKYNKYNK